jgi:hypothetical protein
MSHEKFYSNKSYLKNDNVRELMAYRVTHHDWLSTLGMEGKHLEDGEKGVGGQYKK